MLLSVRSNTYIGMNLEKKIDYFYELVFKNYMDLNSCHWCGKEILVTQDGKYLFFCKLYSGI